MRSPRDRRTTMSRRYSASASASASVPDARPASLAPIPLPLSRHARARAARRNVAPDAVAYVLAHGRTVQRTGVCFCFLGWRDLPAVDRGADWASRLVGTVVLVAPDSGVITVYRHRRALRTILRKTKYRLPPAFPDCADAEDDGGVHVASWHQA